MSHSRGGPCYSHKCRPRVLPDDGETHTTWKSRRNEVLWRQKQTLTIEPTTTIPLIFLDERLRTNQSGHHTAHHSKTPLLILVQINTPHTNGNQHAIRATSSSLALHWLLWIHWILTSPFPQSKRKLGPKDFCSLKKNLQFFLPASLLLGPPWEPRSSCYF